MHKKNVLLDGNDFTDIKMIKMRINLKQTSIQSMLLALTFSH